MDTNLLLVILCVVCVHLEHQVLASEEKKVYDLSDDGAFVKEVKAVPETIESKLDEITDVSICDFESNDMCGYVQASSPDDDFDWTKWSGNTPSYDTGPSVDHTLMTSAGSYMYTEVSSRYGGFSAHLKKQIASDNSDAKHCNGTFTFWYHMYGSDIGTLNVNVSDVLKWTKQGYQGNSWFEGSFIFSASSSDWIIIEGISGPSYRGDIAIDDLELKCHDQSCGGLFTSLHGTFTSPHYPYDYYNDAACTYILDLNEHSGIASVGFHFDDFDLEYGWDYLYYGEGLTVDLSRRLGTLNGYDIPADIVVNGRQIWFYFDSDGSITTSGFNISWTALEDRSCDNRFTSATGTFTSPNYPSNYDNYESCSYVIDIHHSNVSAIGFHFNDFELETWCDYLYYGEGGFVDWSRQLGEFHGHNIPHDEAVFGTQLWFLFESDYSVTYRGFSITWTGLDMDDVTTLDSNTIGSTLAEGTTFAVTTPFAASTTEEDIPDVSFCDFESNGMCGYVQASDDDFDWTKWSGYTPSTNTGPSVDHTLMTSAGSYMYTEVSGRYGGSNARLKKQIASDNSDAKHCKGTFTFWYHMYGSDIGTLNVNVSDMVMWTKQGNQGDNWFEGSFTFSASSSDWIIIEGISGPSYRGDIAIDDLELKCHDQSCGGLFTSLHGTFASPNYPNDYYNDAACTYILDLNGHLGIGSVGFHFNDFDLEYGWDYLYYGEGLTVDLSRKLGTLNGYDIPADIVVNGREIWFYFDSDGSITTSGFNISWTGLEYRSCDNRFTSATGTFTSPNYPSNYDNYESCSYVIDIQHSNVSAIAFHFNDFELETWYDYLYYGEGGFVDWSRQIGEFNGHNIPSDEAVFGTQLWFLFESDSSVTYRGFSLTWIGLDMDDVTTPDFHTIESTLAEGTTFSISTPFASTTEEAPIEPSPVGTVGTDFVLLFLPGCSYNPALVISTPYLTHVQVTIRVPGINYQHSTTVSRHSGQSVLLPVSVYVPVGISSNSVIVEANAGITVHALIMESSSADGFLAVPTKGLGSSYVIASYDPISNSQPSHFAISSLESETDINITTNTGLSRRITLSPYHSYYMQDYYSDLTGSIVTANKPVAVFSGARCSFVPTGIRACDVLTEQMLPFENLGNNFHIAPFPSRRISGYIYRVIATNPDHTTHISITGGIELDLGIGEFFEGNGDGYSITTIEADYPITTVQYMKGLTSGDNTGDPTMLLIPSYDMFSHNVTFSVYEYTQLDFYHASVTISCEDTSGLVLDDSLDIDNHWYRLSNNDICALQGPITPGVHTIGHTNPNAHFYVGITSVGRDVSYAYSAGFNLRRDLTPEPTRPPVTVVDCAEDVLTVYIPRSVIGSVDASHLHFLNESCVGADHNSSHVELTTGFDACGTIMEVQDDYIILSNVVQGVVLQEPGQIVSRDDTIQIPVECRMEKDGLSAINFHPEISKIVYSEHGYGKFSFNLQLYEDGSYVQPYPPEAYPIDIHIRDMMYFEAQVSAKQGLELFVKDCVATLTEDPTSAPQYEILNDGCPSDDTFQLFVSGNPMIRHFGLEAFFFVESQTPVYVHCYLMLCNVTDPNSRCSQGCIAKSDVRKRSVDHTGSKPYVMTRGPFHFRKDLADSGDQSNTTFSSDHLAILMSSMGFLILCVTVSAAILKRLRKQSDYVRVSESDEE